MIYTRRASCTTPVEQLTADEKTATPTPRYTTARDSTHPPERRTELSDDGDELAMLSHVQLTRSEQPIDLTSAQRCHRMRAAQQFDLPERQHPPILVPTNTRSQAGFGVDDPV